MVQLCTIEVMNQSFLLHKVNNWSQAMGNNSSCCKNTNDSQILSRSYVQNPDSSDVSVPTNQVIRTISEILSASLSQEFRVRGVEQFERVIKVDHPSMVIESNEVENVSSSKPVSVILSRQNSTALLSLRNMAQSSRISLSDSNHGKGFLSDIDAYEVSKITERSLERTVNDIWDAVMDEGQLPNKDHFKITLPAFDILQKFVK